MAGKKKRKPGGTSRPARRGKHRSIRYDAEEIRPEDRYNRQRDPAAPPEILLRKLTVSEALDRLEFQLRSYVRQGTKQVLVVHGKGSHSLGGVSVLGPEVRQWCDDHPGLVLSWAEAPSRWGGAGAIVVNMR